MFERWAEKLREKKNRQDDEVEFKEFNEAVEQPKVAEEKPKEEPIIPTPTTAKKGSIEGAGGSNIELKVVRPATFDEVSTIADYLLEGCTVVLNAELLDKPVCIRMLDFLNGVTYSTDGEIKQVSQTTFIITPNNVDVSDDE